MVEQLPYPEHAALLVRRGELEALLTKSGSKFSFSTCCRTIERSISRAQGQQGTEQRTAAQVSCTTHTGSKQLQRMQQTSRGCKRAHLCRRSRSFRPRTPAPRTEGTPAASCTARNSVRTPRFRRRGTSSRLAARRVKDTRTAPASSSCPSDRTPRCWPCTIAAE